MRDDPHVVALVTRASGGDQDAWNELVDRYASLVYTICTRCRLSTGLDDSVLFVDDTAIDEEILVAERNAALRVAFTGLPPRCQRLLSMLVSDPPRSYAEIHAELGIPVGSIGPQRARCLERLRRSDALAALEEGEK